MSEKEAETALPVTLTFPESIGALRLREDSNCNYHLGLLTRYLVRVCSAKKPSGSVTQTHFHSLYDPQMSVEEYVYRVGRYVQCTRECFVIAIILLVRYQQNTLHPICPLNVHRLIITSLLVAAKSRDDVLVSNEYYNQLGGLPDREINYLERYFLTDIDWSTYVSYEEYNWYLFKLWHIAPDHFYIDERQLKANSRKRAEKRSPDRNISSAAVSTIEDKKDDVKNTSLTVGTSSKSLDGCLSGSSPDVKQQTTSEEAPISTVTEETRSNKNNTDEKS